MKKYSLILLTILLIPFTAYSKNMNDIECDFQENDEALVDNILENGGVYKNNNTNGMLCFKKEMVFIPIKKGKVDGAAKWYYPNGDLAKETPYKNGKEDGIAKWYYINGILMQEISFENGKAEGIEKWYYYNGALWVETPYKNGKIEGITKNYYGSGALESETPYKNDKREGIEKKYNENGSLWGIVTYANNKAISGKCANGRKWTNAELHNWDNGLSVDCGR